MKLWSVVSAAALVPAAAAALEVTAARAQEAVKVDGVLSEPSWAVAEEHSLVTYDGKKAAHPTEIRVLYDDEHVYFAFVCHEEHTGQLAAAETRHDGDVWKDDCVEVFLDPAGRAESYVHFMANTLGTRAEEKAVGQERDGSWTVEWEAAAVVDVERKVWTAEIAIPLAALDLSFDVTSTWRFNVNRERQAKAGTKAEFQGLVATPQGFHSPEKFAVLSGLDIDYFPHRAAALGRRIDSHSGACRELWIEVKALTEARSDLIALREGLFKTHLESALFKREHEKATKTGEPAALAALAEKLDRAKSELAALQKKLRTRPERPDDELF